MRKHCYFTICSLLIGGKPYDLRLVVLRGDDDAYDGHYYEYGMAVPESLILDDNIWSTDPETLLDKVPLRFQFQASMDIRLFQRNDLEDALDGSLMADDIEINFENDFARTRP